LDLHLKGFQRLGARIEENHGYIWARSGGLQGSDIVLDLPSVGATENIMTCAALAWGTTVIRNAAREPEVVELARFLQRMGARVYGVGSDTIRVEGVSRLHGCDYTVMPDRIEAGTFLAAAAATGGDVEIDHVIPEHLEAVTAKLAEAGAHVWRSGDRKSTRLNSSHVKISYAVFCLKKKKENM